MTAMRHIDIDGELWKEWRSGYFFSSLGRAGRLLVSGRIKPLRGCASGAGYRAISIPRGNGQYARVYIHRGVCEVFNGPCPSGMECRHLNGDMFDNAPTNLQWGTPTDNTRDKFSHGTVTKGERNGGAKLTTSAVTEMRRLRHEDKLTFNALAKRFGVSTMTAFRATVGQSWN